MDYTTKYYIAIAFYLFLILAGMIIGDKFALSTHRDSRVYIPIGGAVGLVISLALYFGYFKKHIKDE